MAPTSFSFLDIASRLGPSIDAALDVRIPLGDGCPARLREAMRYSLLAPGKRLRPILVLLASEACGGDREAAMPAACAVEMVHAYSLIHDDLPAMDDDDLRRGRPTCHKAFDEAAAILAGDALLTLAFEVLAKEVRPAEVAVACCVALAQAAGACNMIGGQSDDVATEGRKREVSSGERGNSNGRQAAEGENSLRLDPKGCNLPTIESIHHRKTGAMIQVSLKLGALIAKASTEQWTALESYGRRIGLTFQITDDLLDVQSSEATMGKRVRKDAKLGKMTFPGLLGLDQSAQYAQQLVMEAQQDVECFGATGNSLHALATYVLERNR
jgi:geranylgeranyl diphosphate synthase, type II